MSGTDLALARVFDPASQDDWLALVDRTLKGRPADRLVHRTYDDIAIAPLSTRADWPGRDDDPARAGRPAGQGWDIRQAHADPDPTTTNTAILQDLERGVTSIQLIFAGAGRRGGVVVSDTADLDRVLDGVHLNLAPLALAAGADFKAAADRLIALWQARGVAADQALGAFDADPLGTLALTGTLPQGLDAALADMAALAGTSAATYPQVTAVGVSGLPYHGAGASEAQELACVLATGVAYLRALEAGGLELTAAAGEIAVTLAADADVFLTIAKLRAFRRLWAHVLDACGVAGAPTMVTAETAGRMFTRRDPWVNILRATAATFAAGVAGADAITVAPHTAALGLPDGFARRVARNVQVILAEEASIGRVADPAGGAWAIERLTDALAERAWAAFQDIEAAGGMAAALTSGKIAADIAAVNTRRQTDIATRRLAITGVSEFPDLHETPVAARAANGAESRPDQPGDRIDPLLQGRLAEPFETLRDRSDALAADTGSRPCVFLANLGSVAEHTARAAWAKNAFEAGGIEAVASTGFTDADPQVTAFKDSGAAVAVLCGSDGLYADHVVAMAGALKAAGAVRLYVAGRPGDDEAAWREAGVDGFVHHGGDLLDTLRDAWQALEKAS